MVVAKAERTNVFLYDNLERHMFNRRRESGHNVSA